MLKDKVGTGKVTIRAHKHKFASYGVIHIKPESKTISKARNKLLTLRYSSSAIIKRCQLEHHVALSNDCDEEEKCYGFTHFEQSQALFMSNWSFERRRIFRSFACGRPLFDSARQERGIGDEYLSLARFCQRHQLAFGRQTAWLLPSQR